MTNNEKLEKELDRLHTKYADIGVILFGIKYGSECGKNIDSIVQATFSKKRKSNGEKYGEKTYKTEAKRGQKLAEFVELKKDV